MLFYGGRRLRTYIFDCEVFAYDWLFVFKDIETKEYTIIHNDNDAVKYFMERNPLLCGFNNKNYDQFILRAVLDDAFPDEVKALNDFIIGGNRGWDYPLLGGKYLNINQFDLMDDCQMGISLKAFEAHMGMDIRETTVPFDINRPLTDEELEEVIFYCKHDVDATELLYHVRKNYLDNKEFLGSTKGIEKAKALYMTNAKLTSAYLDATRKEYDDEREYKYPSNLLSEYIPQEAFDFFDKLYDESILDEQVFKRQHIFYIDDLKGKLAFGGIHGAIPTYREKATETRTIRNQDVASFYPHLMTIDGYCSRSIPNSKVYADMLERRMRAKKSGDKSLANALKLVANTTYGAMLNRYNDLCDPLMGRSVCISGQLRLLELTYHLVAECPTLKPIQINTDGIMVSLDNCDLDKYYEICNEWQERTGFELEEDFIKEIIQKDVNNYIEIPMDGSEPKIKGTQLVRGVLTNGNNDFTTLGFPNWDNLSGGAFKINNDATIVAKAIIDYFVNDIPVQTTIKGCNEPLQFQLIAKASSKYSGVYHVVDGERVPVQKCNRVYAVKNTTYGTLYKIHKETGEQEKIGGLPTHCIIDNSNEISIETIDKSWYIRQAKKNINDFLGIEPPKKNTRKINSIKKKLLALLEE